MWFCFVIYCLFASRAIWKPFDRRLRFPVWVVPSKPNLPYPPPPLFCECVTWHWSCESTVSDFIGFVCKVLCRSFVANISASATFLWIQSNALTWNHKNMTGYASRTSQAALKRYVRTKSPSGLNGGLRDKSAVAWSPTIIARWIDVFHVVSYENNLQARDLVIFILYYEKW